MKIFNRKKEKELQIMEISVTHSNNIIHELDNAIYEECYELLFDKSLVNIEHHKYFDFMMEDHGMKVLNCIAQLKELLQELYDTNGLPSKDAQEWGRLCIKQIDEMGCILCIIHSYHHRKMGLGILTPFFS